MRGCFITGTDTGVGKTVLAAAIVASLRARGISIRVLKPVITGLEDAARAGWPPDHELLAAVAGSDPAEVALLGFGLAASPHLAAATEGRKIEPSQLRGWIRAAAQRGEFLVVEGVGGLLVPLCEEYGVRELAGELELPLVIAARPGLGTINHTLLTLEAARHAGVQPAAVVLTPWPELPSVVESSNRETIARLGKVRVATLPHVARPEPELLALAGDSLALEQWLVTS